jgi:hypothetical protein
MKKTLSLITVILYMIQVAWASNKTAEIHQKMKKNMETYCNKGVQVACDMKKDIDNPGAAMANLDLKKDLQEMNKEQQEAMLVMFQKLQACGKDMACLQKLGDEEAKKGIAQSQKECQAGSQEGCFMQEHLHLTNEMQQSLGSP